MAEVAEQLELEPDQRIFSPDEALKRLQHGLCAIVGLVNYGDSRTMGSILEDRYHRLFDDFPGAFRATDSCSSDNTCWMIEMIDDGRIRKVGPVYSASGKTLRPEQPIDREGAALWIIPNFRTEYKREPKLNFDWRYIVEENLERMCAKPGVLNRIIPVVLELLPMTDDEVTFAMEKHMFICSAEKENAAEGMGDRMSSIFENLTEAIRGYPESLHHNSYEDHVLRLGSGATVPLFDKAEQLREAGIEISLVVAAVKRLVEIVRARRFGEERRRNIR